MTGDEETRRARVAEIGQVAAVVGVAGDERALAELVEALGDESWRVRKEAALRAADWADPDAAARVLVEALAEPDNVGRRNAVVEALSRLGRVALAPLLAALDRKPEHRKLIVDTLGLIGDRGATAALAASLLDADPNVRAAAAESLGRVGGAEAEAALAAALDGSDLLMSVACLAALNMLGAVLPPSRLEPLLDTPVLAPQAIVALGNAGLLTAAGPLVARLPDRSRAVREAAILSLARLSHAIDERGETREREAMTELVGAAGAEVEALLVEALLEGARATRQAAATLLGAGAQPSAVRALVLALSHEETRDAAFAALVRIGPAAYDALVAAAAEEGPLRPALFRLMPEMGTSGAARETLLIDGLADEEIEAATEAARALGDLGTEAAVAPLVAALEREEIAAAAAWALDELAGRLGAAVRAPVLAALSAAMNAAHGSSSSAPRLVRVLGACRFAGDLPLLLRLLADDEDAGLRAAAAEALSLPGDPGRPDQILPILIAALRDPAPGVRATVARLLADSTSPAATEALALAAADAVASVRAAAVLALASRADAASRAALALRKTLETDPLVTAALASALFAATPGA